MANADVVKQIRRATRRKFSAEEKIRIVVEGLRGEVSVADRAADAGPRTLLPGIAVAHHVVEIQASPGCSDICGFLDGDLCLDLYQRDLGAL